MRISDWSSDVCSSDLADGNGHGHGDKRDDQGAEEDRHGAEGALACRLVGADRDLRLPVEAEQELAQGYTVEEPERLEEQRNHRSEEHTSELQSLMRISYAVFCLKKKKNIILSSAHRNQLKTCNI